MILLLKLILLLFEKQILDEQIWVFECDHEIEEDMLILYEKLEWVSLLYLKIWFLMI